MFVIPAALAALIIFAAVMTFTGAGFDEEWASKIAPMVACFAVFTGLYAGELHGFTAGLAAAALAAAVMYLPGVLRARRPRTSVS